jgi:hypothetical protein
MRQSFGGFAAYLFFYFTLSSLFIHLVKQKGKERVMRKVIFTFLVLAFLPLSNLFSQAVYYSEGFETYDSTQFPAGWLTKYRGVPINDYANWKVRDSGTYVPGLATNLVKAYQSKRSMTVSWRVADTGTAAADAWLITKKFAALPNDGILTFYAAGGSSYLDSMQILISPTGDTAYTSFQYLQTLVWPGGNSSNYGVFEQTIIDLAAYVGTTPRFAFRYCTGDCNNDGYAVFVDKVEMLGTIGITQIGNNIPKKFAMSQNYPNPFNPTTKIKFDVPKNGNVTVEVFNNLGQLVSTLHNGYTTAGFYETSFDGSKLTSGMYFYRITSKDFVETKKMILVK